MKNYDSSNIYKLLTTKINESNIIMNTEFKLICLNEAHEVIAISNINSVTETFQGINQKLLINKVIAFKASLIIIIKVCESDELIRVSIIPSMKKLIKALNYFDIIFLDYLIINPDMYFSYRERGFF